MCLEPTKTALAGRERGPGLVGELHPAADRVLELRAVRLDRERRARRGADGAPEQDVVAEDEIGRQLLSDARRVRVDVASALVRRELLQQPRLEPLVRVEDEHGQQATGERGRHDLRSGEVEPLWLALLADDRHLVPGAAPRAGDLPRVDVRARAREEVSVPEDDLHSIEGAFSPAQVSAALPTAPTLSARSAKRCERRRRRPASRTARALPDSSLVGRRRGARRPAGGSFRQGRTSGQAAWAPDCRGSTGTDLSQRSARH